MPENGRAITILLADDDEDDRLMTREALLDARLRNDLRFAFDGVDLLDYLHRRGRHADPGASPRPGLILLDLNMPRMDGRELRLMAHDHEWREQFRKRLGHVFVYRKPNDADAKRRADGCRSGSHRDAGCGVRLQHLPLERLGCLGVGSRTRVRRPTLSR